ncbi:MAG: tetratricopeptide repeat protein [Desulfobacteraceae bacterium]|jgi:tetratricopeptide (TPR) repeat protein
MDLLSGVTADNLFVNSMQQQYQMESLANQALSRGIDRYTKQDYEGAANEFQRAVNLSPTSDYSVDATKYLAQSYLKLEKTDKAIEAYRNTLTRQPGRDDLQLELGNVLYAEDRFEEAVQAYQKAVNIDPSSLNQFSLAQGLMQTGRYEAARAAFRNVIRLEPLSAHGYLGLGQAYAKEGDYDSAIEQFEKALDKQSDYYEAYAEIGYAYADMGEIEEAKDLAEFLEGKDDELAALLDAYINKVEPPKMLLAWGTSSFRYSKSFQTPLSAMDSYFETANASKTMNMKILFNKDMDRSSVENPLNWNISRAQGATPAQTYNFGQSVPDTEISIDPIPNFVLYDAETKTATISFTVQQNSTADGTIDPSHMVFKFSGKDSEGIQIHAEHDEFSGFSRVA